MKLCSKCVKQFPDDANFCPVCASRLTAAPAEGAAVAGSDGDSLAARFEVGATVGGGRTGAVFDGNDKTTSQRVAVKVIAAPVTAAAGVSARIERETKQLERVVSPGIAKIVAWGKRGESSWIATEFVAGAQTLATAINDRGPIGLAGAAEVIEVVGEALIEAAQVGVVHRDLAPKNILFAGDDIKVINFSVPVPTSDKSPGVPEFVAPEVVEGKPADQRSNIYSLGAIFYFALTGRPPFTGTTEAVHQGHLTGTPALPSTLVQVSSDVDAVVMRALERSPSKRFLTVRQFVDEALRVAKGTPVSAAMLAANASAPNKRGALVQTLMGVRAHELSAPAPVAVAAPASAPVAAAVAAAPAVASAPVAAVAPAPAAAAPV
nr:serine/threonine-protein kinase [Kofleriaceae bacterium]